MNFLALVTRSAALIVAITTPLQGSERTHGGRIRSGGLPAYLQAVEEDNATPKVYAQMLKARAKYLAVYEPALLSEGAPTEGSQPSPLAVSAGSGPGAPYVQSPVDWSQSVSQISYPAPYISSTTSSAEVSASYAASTASSGGFSPEASKEAQRRAWNEYQESEAESKRRTVVPYQVAPQSEAAQGKTEYVKGYFRPDGQYVKPYFRRPGEY